jgi:histidyl-tRNA synthetase
MSQHPSAGPQSPAVVKPERPGGFLDYLPADFLAREKMLATISQVFRSFGYDPIETPRIEFLKTLAGETSDTGKNIFHIKGATDDEPLAMPFDHTVPLARLLAANPYQPKKRTGIRLPWRRMVIGPVFRADSPQSGRYRQFYQCDVDIAGTASMLADAEIVAMMVRVLQALDVRRFKVRLNNRKILNGMKDLAGIEGRGPVGQDEIVREMMRILDKLDKIGIDAVVTELTAAPASALDPKPNLSAPSVEKIKTFITLSGDNREKLARCRQTFAGIAVAQEGIDELEQVLGYLPEMGVETEVVDIDFHIARGLDYYTGPVMETTLEDAPEFGSVISGGRYNNLVSRFTGKELPATGTSIGVDRLYAALSHIDALDKSRQTVAEVMVMRLTRDRDGDYLKMAAELRVAGLNTELCMVEDTTFKSQFNFAISRGVRFVVICGESEFEKRAVQVKDLQTREQVEIGRGELVRWFARGPVGPLAG